jgi:hypothetical protein
MGNVLLSKTTIVPPLSSASSLAAFDVSGAVNGITCNIPGLGNFYYNNSSSATADNITVIEPTSGIGRWLIQKPTISNNNRFLGLLDGSIGPSSEIPFTDLGYSILNASSGANIRNAISSPSLSGSNATGTWPISVTGHCGDLIGPQVTSHLGVTSINENSINYSLIKKSSPISLLGNSKQISHNIEEIFVGDNLYFTEDGKLDARGLSGALLQVDNLSDLNNISTARDNLGLGKAALKDITDQTKAKAVMLSSFTSGSYAKFDDNGSLIDGGADPAGTLIASNNLSDVDDIATSRLNLELSDAALKNVTDNTKTTAVMLSTFTSGNYAKFDSQGSLVDGGGNPALGCLIASNNLADVSNRANARENIGLGEAAVVNVTDTTKTNAVMLSSFTSGNYAKFDSKGSLIDGGSTPAGALLSSNNLSDVEDIAISRTNIGLGEAAIVGVTDTSKTNAVMLSSFTNGNYAKFDNKGSLVDGGGDPAAGCLVSTNNLSDLESITTSRLNLGLGASALKGVTDLAKANVVMLSSFTNGNYPKFDSKGSLVDGGGNPAAGCLTAINNLSDLNNISTSRTNLGLGAAAVVGVTDASKTNAVMLSSFSDGSYAKFDNAGSVIDGGPTPWLSTMNLVSSDTQVQMQVNQTYYFNGDFDADLLLPTSAKPGDTVHIINTLDYNALAKNLIVHQNASQKIYLGGDQYTTNGTGGSLKNKIYGTKFSLKCIVENNVFILCDVCVPSIFLTGISVPAFTSV